MKRVFLIVLDSFGIGEMKDAALYKDAGSNTIKSVSMQKEFFAPNLKKLGLFNIDGVSLGNKENAPLASFARLSEKSKGKDTTTGHWEMAGIILDKPFPVYENGFPDYIIKEFEEKTKKKVLCNKPYSGTAVINDYGDEAIKKDALIVYTSQDSVFQIAAHEDYVDVNTLYEYCQIARDIMQNDDAVGRIIARPFVGTSGNYTRTANRHDFSLKPIKKTMLDYLKENNYDVISIGKIVDIFANEGITKAIRTKNNLDGMQKTLDMQKQDFEGLCFVNLVDFDMLYGHRNDAKGYAKAISEFDQKLGEFLLNMQDDDVLIITADHGCDPLTESTDHSREYVPLLIYGNKIKKGVNLKTIEGFDTIATFVTKWFNLKNIFKGEDIIDKVNNEK